MRPAFCSLMMLSALAATAADARVDVADTPATATPVLGDMCAYPADWAPPFTHVYRFKNGATLVFVGVEHTSDPADATHRRIRAAIAQYKPSLVLIEGASSAKSASDRYRAFLIDSARQKMAAGAVSENLYAALLATDAGASISGWDFSPDQDYRVLVDDRFNIRDALGAHLLRSHIDPFRDDGGQADVTRQLRYVAVVQPVAAFDYAGWYRKAYGDRFDPANGTPCGTGIGARVVRDLSNRRNLNLIGLIDRNALPGRTIMVEAGAGHWLALRDWLLSRSTRVD